MTVARTIEAVSVVALFLGYVGLWRLKRAREHRRTGVDPEVLARATAPVQAYFAGLVWLMTAFVVAIIGLHTFAPDAWPSLVRVGVLDSGWFDLVGGVLGVVGLGLCVIAQVTMGSSWRVGIDIDRRTDLVTGGIYRWIRNPTYLGLHLMNLGLWLIWPTTLVAGYAVLFFVVMDIQVRAEEEHLVASHGDAYHAYAARTWRYVPRLY